MYSCAKAGTQEPIPHAVSGVLDLRGWNFTAKGSISLAGEWKFFPAKFLYDATEENGATFRTVPDLWKGLDAGSPNGMGYGTYILRVLLPKDSGLLALRWCTLSTAFELQLNGKSAAKAGIPGINPKEAVAAYNPGFALVPNQGQELEIIFRISNWDYRSGGIWRPVYLGLEGAVKNEKRNADFLGLGLFAALLTIGLNSLLIFLFRRKEIAYLYFAFFAALMGLRTLVTGEYLLSALFPAIPFHAIILMEYLTVSLSMFVCSSFFINFFPVKIPKWLKAIMLSAPLAYAVFTIVAPLPLITRSPGVIYVIIIASTLTLFIKIFIPALIKRMQGSRLIFCGAIILSIATINDMLFSSFIIITFDSVAYAQAIFLFLQMIALAGRFAGTINRSEIMAEELGETNRRLRDEIVVNVQKQESLEGLLEEKNLLIREVHHRVKNSLQIISSILSLQANRVKKCEECSMLKILRFRIQALSLVHEKLYVHVSTGSIMLNDYLKSLIALLATGYGLGKDVISINLPKDEIEVDIDSSIDIGLIVTELVSNACKYGRGTDQVGSIEVNLATNDTDLIIRLRDQGPGFPEGFDPNTSKTLGYLMVLTLLKRSKGVLEISEGTGGNVEVRMPLARIKC